MILGARAAVYRGAAVLFGAEDGAARNGILGARAANTRGWGKTKRLRSSEKRFGKVLCRSEPSLTAVQSFVLAAASVLNEVTRR